MPRLILIDRNSGYIFGDTADYGARLRPADWYNLTPIEAARLLDEDILNPLYAYAETQHTDPAAVYHVYADQPGSDTVAVITDGQSQDQIDAVERDCRYVTSLLRSRLEDAA